MDDPSGQPLETSIVVERHLILDVVRPLVIELILDVGTADNSSLQDDGIGLRDAVVLPTAWLAGILRAGCACVMLKLGVAVPKANHVAKVLCVLSQDVVHLPFGHFADSFSVNAILSSLTKKFLPLNAVFLLICNSVFTLGHRPSVDYT